MKLIFLALFWALLITQCLSADLTNYEYFTNTGIKSGLKAESVDFTLNGKQLTLFSGSLHYFRVPKEYWRDRLLKMRAAGLNAVQTYAPWNLHEETPGHFDFETGLLNLAEFLKTAKEVDLFVIFRIGPYICAEWEMGGFPSWLIRDPHMKLRTTYKPYLNAVENYFNKVLTIINDYQFIKGGPIIALQFENEFGGIWHQNDHDYFEFLRSIIVRSGFKEFLFTCDNGKKAPKAATLNLKGILTSTNMNSGSLAKLNDLRKSQPNRPLYVSEFWPGWYDDWSDKGHKTMTVQYFEKEVTDILFVANASINFYMFSGGTNFGFTNGADDVGSMVTSYDYNSPLTESCNYTDKYWKAKELFAKLTEERGLPKTHIPEPPKITTAANYGVIHIKDYLSFEDLLTKIKPIESIEPKYMEMLNIGHNYGQNFGFTLYRVETNKKFKNLKISGGVSDRGVVLIDNKEVAVIHNKEYQLKPSESQFENRTDHKLDILVENTGRINGWNRMSTARKGFNGEVVLDDQKALHYKIFPMEFKQKFVESLKSMRGRAVQNISSPSLFRAELHITGEPRDTYLRLDNWTKGNVFINGFNIGRYYEVGPQKALYVAAPLLKTGSNDIYIFELHKGSDKINFVNKPDLGKPIISFGNQ